MLYEVEIRPLGVDRDRERVCDEFDLLTGTRAGADLVSASARGYLLEGAGLTGGGAMALAAALLVDPVVEAATVRELPARPEESVGALTVLPKPGVTDPAAQSVLDAAARLGVSLSAVRTFRRYFAPDSAPAGQLTLLSGKLLANAAIEQVVAGPLQLRTIEVGRGYEFRHVEVRLSGLDDAALIKLSQAGQLALSADEMRRVRDHFAASGREPTECELETVAQTWSEHCSHKTLKGRIEYRETIRGMTRTVQFENMLKETVFAATQEIIQSLGAANWCVSVFADNAGVVRFSESNHLAIKVETHNRPSAIEPYGGANTGLGGVIRDILGTALGARPVASTDVFCFAPPTTPESELPPGVIHPRRILQGVVAGVRDYGNRMGIPTVNGSVFFDPRYLANPLVFCGTVGLVPVGFETKRVAPGDLVVAVGGRTGRDGIHGATFSSVELTAESESISGGAVQIGHAIQEKMVLDVLLAARDRRLYTSITDCGAGGFSSAVGEMAEGFGAEVHLDRAPLKYAGLSPTEIWISESQERMVLAVPPGNWDALRALCAAEGVEAVALGTFTDSGRLKLYYQSRPVADIELEFLHGGRPPVNRLATYTLPAIASAPPATAMTPGEILLAILAMPSVASKEWIVRQYDHEVQAGSVIKPLVGIHEDGPSDAAVIAPELGSRLGAAIGHGLCPQFAEFDPAASAACAIDEAVRNVVAVGADPSRIAILDNFCWGNVADPEQLGALVRAANECRRVAVAYGTPFVSGKDSLNNEYRGGERRITIPPTLLITALGLVRDTHRCVSMDFKEAGNAIYLIGETRDELAGSHACLVTGERGSAVPTPDVAVAPKLFRALHAAIQAGLVRACHDCSEGGLAAALAEMAFAGGLGAEVPSLGAVPGPQLSDAVRLFSESPTRFIVEVPPGHEEAFTAGFAGLPCAKIGATVAEQRLRVGAAIDLGLAQLKEAWQRPLRF